jgi:hypothetical protein
VILALIACRGGDDPDADVSDDATTPSTGSDTAPDSPPDRETAPPSDTGEPSDTQGPTDSGGSGPTFAAELDALCINEFMPSNALSLLVDGVAWDWIELHNQGAVPVALDGWSLSDDADDPRAFEFPPGTVIEAGAFVVWLASGDVSLGPDHLPFALDQDGEEVGLFAPSLDGEVVTFDAFTTDVAAYRTVDCGFDTWERGWLGTPGLSNEP